GIRYRNVTGVQTCALPISVSENTIYVDESSGDRFMVRVIPIKHEDEILGAIYFDADIERMFNQMDEINQILFGGTAVSLSITIVIGIFIAQTMTRPISDMRRQAQEMAKGNFSRKVRVYGDDEIGQLAVAFNHL